MNTFTLNGKPKKTVTLEIDGQSLTFTEGVEIAVFVVVNAAPDALRTCTCGTPFEQDETGNYYCPNGYCSARR